LQNLLNARRMHAMEMYIRLQWILFSVNKFQANRIYCDSTS